MTSDLTDSALNLYVIWNLLKFLFVSLQLSFLSLISVKQNTFKEYYSIAMRQVSSTVLLFCR